MQLSSIKLVRAYLLDCPLKLFRFAWLAKMKRENIYRRGLQKTLLIVWEKRKYTGAII